MTTEYQIELMNYLIRQNRDATIKDWKMAQLDIEDEKRVTQVLKWELEMKEALSRLNFYEVAV